MEKKTKWQKVRENIGFICGLISVLWWFGVTPEMVGQQVHAVGFYVAPFVMFASGVAVGWNACSKKCNKKTLDAQKATEAEHARKEEEIRKKNERLYNKILGYPIQYKSILMDAINNEKVTVPFGDDAIADSLKKDGLLEKVGSKKLGGRDWRATELAIDLINEDHIELLHELQGADFCFKMKKHNELLDEQQEDFLALPMGKRMFAYKVWHEEKVDVSRHDVSGIDGDSKFLNKQDIGHGKNRYTIHKDYVDLFNERKGECFETVIEQLNKLHNES